ncbi:IS3 family transposase [Mycoplasmopsis verecunda]|uniref:IS3 family transposase n=1 Tax=Mycoplasmopsis verecunda TaxID=171291 RepID=UPI0009993DF3
MSRVGNSLDNREIEYFFSIFKSEFLYKINIKELTYDEFVLRANYFINWYNNSRIQSVLDWKTPSDAWCLNF